MTEAATGADLKDARILVVDDIPRNIQVLGSALRNQGYEIVPAAGGEQALRSAATHLPELVLLDVMMPGMNGYETLERLRALPGCEETPVIFVTALNDEVDEEKGLRLGAVDYITKPVSIPIALARVATHLRLARARRQLARQNAELVEAAKLREDVERITRHDLKNPLQIIIGAPGMLGSVGGVNEQQAKMLYMIRNAGYRMLEMINSSLDLYKMETGAYRFKPVPVDLIPLLTRIREELASHLDRKALAWALHKDGAPPAPGDAAIVPAEELLCYSMFANLIKNAIEASPECETIAVSIVSQPPVRVSIHNRGAVPEPIRARFFDKYATHGKQHGTGLGTYSARLIAEAQKGSIAMQTCDIDGTIVSVSFSADPIPAGQPPSAG